MVIEEEMIRLGVIERTNCYKRKRDVSLGQTPKSKRRILIKDKKQRALLFIENLSRKPSQESERPLVLLTSQTDSTDPLDELEHDCGGNQLLTSSQEETDLANLWDSMYPDMGEDSES